MRILWGMAALCALTACTGGRIEVDVSGRDAPVAADARESQTFRLAGTVTGVDGPLPGALVAARGASVADAVTDAAGRFALDLPEGSYTVSVTADCHAPTGTDLALDADQELALTLAAGDLQPPAAPGGLHGNPGPGVAQATVAWQAPAESGSGDVIRYRVYRDGQPFALLGNTLVFGDSGATGPHSYAVAAVNACGVEGPVSAALDVTALPGALVEAPVSAAPEAEVSTNVYKVLDAKGNVVGERQWRTVRGLGNCCETYVASDGAGKLYEYGGTNLYVSSDEGESWTKVSNVVPAVNAEGAAVGAPGGDLLAVNWDAYTGDQLFSHKYVAATDTWYTARTPLHQPLFDRPWVAVIEGPFEIQGVVIPYISFLMSNYAHGDVLLMSLDGLQYQAPNLRELPQGMTSISLDLPVDPDRDWTQAMRQTSVTTIDGGMGLRDRSLRAGCAQAVLTGPLEWSCPDWGELGDEAPAKNDVVRVDSKGRTHITSVVPGEGQVRHRLTTDGGLTWKRAVATVPNRMFIEDWDVQVNAALDQVVMVVHAKKPAGSGAQTNQDMVFRFVDLAGDFHLKEILLVGTGDHVFGEGLGASDDRFDYTTVALLPSGHVSLSFGDASHVPPAIAIEMADPEAVGH